MYGKLGLPLKLSLGEHELIRDVKNAYNNWESGWFHYHDVRVGISALVVRKFWRQGMKNVVSKECFRDVSMVVLLFLFGRANRLYWV